MAADKPYVFRAGGTAGAAEALTSATDIHIFAVPFRCVVKRVGVTIATTISSSGSVVVDFDRVPKSAGTREDAFETLTIPTATATGSVYYADVGSEKILYEGDTLAVQVSTGSTSAGTGYPWILVNVVEDVAGNNSAMTKSA